MRLAQTQENPSLIFLSSVINLVISLISAAIVVPFGKQSKQQYIMISAVVAKV
ncbi:MAG: hypothetical protein HC907_31155 [Richelia sp. SM1_7_0]|nr:hypothetical protein [Richelia sp. SM1_7_0]